MKHLYNFAIVITYQFLKIVALVNPKINLFIQGRKQTFSLLQQLKNEKVVWFHAASLGEFEQAIPIIEKVKKKYTDYKILVTFFSPSGYEIRKNYPLADVVCYLPFDTKKNAQKFVETLNIQIAIFVKYEFWPNLLFELQKQQIKTILISGIFRENQVFFKYYGGFFRKSLEAFDYFFLQNETSKNLLESIVFLNCIVAGDTRFDRVSKILKSDNSIDFIRNFVNNSYTIVAGSTWQEDEELLVNYINQTQYQKFVIAPHKIDNQLIYVLKKSIKKPVALYSEHPKNLEDFDVLIVDTIGLLTKIYSYADVAYVGGAFKTGLHNILEPATFGIPIIIGNKFDKFQEAKDLVQQNGCFSVNNQQELNSIFDKLYNDTKFREKTGNICFNYVSSNIGATKKIMNYINAILK